MVFCLVSTLWKPGEGEPTCNGGKGLVLVLQDLVVQQRQWIDHVRSVSSHLFCRIQVCLCLERVSCGHCQSKRALTTSLVAHFSVAYRPQVLGTMPIVIPTHGRSWFGVRPSVGMHGFTWALSINISAKAARSVGFLAMIPTPSKLSLNLKMPSSGTDPGPNFMPYRPLQLAGRTTDPAVSVPMAMGQKPAATQTAEPDEEPPGVCRDISSGPPPCVMALLQADPRLPDPDFDTETVSVHHKSSSPLPR